MRVLGGKGGERRGGKEGRGGGREGRGVGGAGGAWGGVAVGASWGVRLTAARV